MEDPRRARVRMALSFAVTSGVVLLTLGSVLFVLLVRERSIELTHRLEHAADETIRAAAVIAGQRSSSARVAAEAVSEIETDDVPLYLFDSSQRYFGPATPPPPVSRAARRALVEDVVRGSFDLSSQTWRMVAEAFTIRSDEYVVVAVTDESVLDRQYLRLIRVFALAALLGIVLLGFASYYFAGRAIQPIVANAEAIRRFTTDAAHELRTPIAAVRAQAEVALQRAHRDTAAAGTLRTIVNETSRLSTLVGDLLTLARADTGERVIAREGFYLDDVVSDATAAVSALAREKQIRLAQGRYEQARMTGDERLVRQLLTILLDNALKYTPAGGSITTDVYATDSECIMAVEDSGPGVAAEDAYRIFERFYRGRVARETTSGAGLGLSIAQWIAAAHDGRIEVLPSAASTGARFEVRFPRRNA